MGEKPGGFIERKNIAEQIKKSRKGETTPGEIYTTDRKGREYLYRMGGLKNLFNYLGTLDSKKILDIGSGSGKAINAISEMPIARNLNFDVTALHNNSEIKRNFTKGKIHITAAETLRGIENASLAAVLALNSVAYSTAPKLAMKRIDEVLVPGGVFKGTFNPFGDHSHYADGRLVFKDPQEFIYALATQGYDLAFKDNFFVTTEPEFDPARKNSIVIGVKPGNPKAPKAQTLLDSDFAEIKNEAIGQEPDTGHDVFDLND